MKKEWPVMLDMTLSENNEFVEIHWDWAAEPHHSYCVAFLVSVEL